MSSRSCITRLIDSLARLINGWGRAAGAPQALSWRVKQLINRVTIKYPIDAIKWWWVGVSIRQEGG